ncbi:MAG: electron transport complex subunit E [Candidatus Cloacimonetes bacterium]|nr:electron transport complex subunit E [Candidatus Cloacimonadota bacterium]
MNNFSKGIIKENPIFVLVLGMCPALAVTTSAINAIGMGLATTFVLICSNILISLMKNLIPDKVRIPCYIIVIASFATICQLVMEAYTPELYGALGIFIPLIVVNCIILGRAEAFASKNNVLASFLDGFGMGLGFTMSLILIGSVRELLGTGEVLGYAILPEAYQSNPMLIAILAPGAFLTMGLLMGGINMLKGVK